MTKHTDRQLVKMLLKAVKAADLDLRTNFNNGCNTNNPEWKSMRLCRYAINRAKKVGEL